MTTPPTLPALSDSRRLRIAVFTAYYLLQGLPWGLNLVALPAWLISLGMETASIATFAFFTALPWALKLFVAPLMDRYAYLPMGMRRPWILGAQTAMLMTACLLFFITDPITQYWPLLSICTALSAFAAAEDVAVDGLAIAIAPENERGRLNAFMGSGQVIGISITGSASVALLNRGGVPAAALFLIGAIAALTAVTVLVRERPGERLLPWTRGSANPASLPPEPNLGILLKDLLKGLLLPMSLLTVAVVSLQRINYGIYKVWAPEIAIREFGYSDSNYANWVGTASVVAALTALALGPAIDRVGAHRAYRYVLFAAACLYPTLYLCVDLLVHPLFAIAALLLLYLESTLLFITFIALSMTLCRVKVASTQFACYMAFSNLLVSLGSGLYPAVVERVGLRGVLLALGAAYACGWLLIGRFDRDGHKRRLAALDGTAPADSEA